MIVKQKIEGMMFPFNYVNKSFGKTFVDYLK